MTTQIIGEIELKVSDRWKQAEQILNDYSQSIGTTAIAYNNESEKSLNLKSEDLKKLTPEEISIHAYTLAHYASFVQKEINRQNAKLKWANHNLNLVIAKVGAKYGDKWTKYDERRVMVASDNEYAKILYDITLQAGIRVSELDFLSSRISAMSDLLNELHKTKKYTR